MNLTEAESKYFKGLTLLEKSISEEERRYQLCQLLESVPKQLVKTKKYRQFSLISNWLNMAILALSEVKGFSITEESAFEMFGHRVRKSEIIEALELLENEGLLKHQEAEYIPVYQAVVSDNDITDAGIQAYHRGACNLAIDAIEEQNVEQREFQSFCLSVSEDKIPVAKELIRKFRDELCQLVGGQGDQVYKTNIQFFQLSRRANDSLAAREFAQGMPKMEEKK